MGRTYKLYAAVASSRIRSQDPSATRQQCEPLGYTRLRERRKHTLLDLPLIATRRNKNTTTIYTTQNFCWAVAATALY